MHIDYLDYIRHFPLQANLTWAGSQLVYNHSSNDYLYKDVYLHLSCLQGHKPESYTA